MSEKLLKVKIKSLAAESKIIRLEEERLKRKANNAKEDEFETKQKFWSLFLRLNEHRTKDVRIETRHSLIAYAYIRKVSYMAVEGGARWRREPFDKQAPDWGRIRDLVMKYGSVPSWGLSKDGKERVLKEIKEWASVPYS